MLAADIPRRSVRAALAIALFLILPLAALGGEAKRARILMVIDTHADGALRFGAGVDRDNMKNTLINGLKQNGLRFTLTILQGASVTPKRILQHYENLKVEADETLVFYYTGHGCADRAQGQLLTMKHGILSRADLRSAMMKHAPKLAVILTDCCSNGFPANAPPTAEGLAPKALAVERPKQRGSVLRDLLFRHEGLVVISAAKLGQEARGNAATGSNFTIALCSLFKAPASRFDKNKDGLVEWREFFPHLQQETFRVSHASHAPQAFYLGQPFRP